MSKPLTIRRNPTGCALPHPFTEAPPAPPAVATLPIDAHDCALCMAEATRQVREVSERLSHEARIAGTLQRTLLPIAIPQVDDFEIAAAYQAGSDEALVGGDFYDLFELSPGRLVMVVGDVCGMGLDAAAQVAMLRHMLRYAVYRHNAIGPALSELSAILAERVLLSDFATVFVAICDVPERRIEYASCGHTPAIVVRSAYNPSVQLLMPTGPLLGPKTGMPIRSETHQLATGDGIVVYTDGLIERGAHHSELSTFARVIRAIRENYQGLTADALADRIYREARSRSKIAVVDDVCLLVGRFSAPSDDGLSPSNKMELRTCPETY